MALHVVVDSTGGFALGGFSSQDNRPAGLALQIHVHDDDFLPPALVQDAGPATVHSGTVDPEWKAVSQTAAPLLPPPKFS